MKRVILWFRQDLRLHDNEALTDALKEAGEIVPVYVFDQRIFEGKTEFGFNKIGDARTRFIVEAVEDLRQNIRALGSELIVRVGRPENEIFKLAREIKSSWISCNRERTTEESTVENALEKKLWTIGQEIRYSRGKMLLYTSDLPYPVSHTPDNFITFRKETERFVTVRRPLDTPRSLTPFTTVIEPGQIPSAEYLLNRTLSISFQNKLMGGESQALRQLVQLNEIFQSENISGDEAVDESMPRFSPWLAQGCLSPKTLHASIKGNLNNCHRLSKQIISGLLYRDYLRLMVKKHGRRIFNRNGVRGESDDPGEDYNAALIAWTEGRTGAADIDAAMNQLSEYGVMHVRLRKMCAIFLIRDLGVDWRLGASYFESTLLDYDPCSNWTNWCNIAGVGPDMRAIRNGNYN